MTTTSPHAALTEEQLQNADAAANHALEALAKRFLDIADDTCRHAASTAAQALSVVNTYRQMLEYSRKMAPPSVSTPMSRYADPAACRQQAKANVLEAKALSFRTLARENASIANRLQQDRHRRRRQRLNYRIQPPR